MKKPDNKTPPRTFKYTDREYTGEKQNARRAGTEKFDQIPSRVGDTLHYRDGRKVVA